MDVGERRDQHGRIVYRIDHQPERAVGRERSVAGGHADLDRAVEVGRRGAAEGRPVEAEPGRQRGPIGEAGGERQRVAIDVGERPRRNRERERGVFGAVTVGERCGQDRRVVDRRYGQAEGVAGRELAVSGADRDVEDAVEVGGRHSGKPARCGVEGQPRGQWTAVAQPSRPDQRIAIDVGKAVARQGERHRAVFERHDVVEHPREHRRIVDRGDRQREIGRGGELTVAGGHPQRQRAIEVGRRGAGERSVGESQPARQRIAAGQRCTERQRIPIDIGEGPGGQSEADDGIFRAGPVGGRDRQDRRVVDRIDGQDELVAGAEFAVAGGDAQVQATVEVGRRLSGKPPACGIERQPGRQRAAIGQGRGIRERRTVDIGESAGRKREIDARVLGRMAIRQGQRDERGVVYLRYPKRESRAGRQGSIAGGHPQRDAAVEVLRRGAGEARAIERDPRRQRIAAGERGAELERVAIAICEGSRGDGDREGGVFGNDRVARRNRHHRRIVNRIDRQAERLRGRQRAVAGDDRDIERAVVVVRRLAGQRLAIERQPTGQRVAVGEPGGQAQRVAIAVGERVGGDRDGDRGILGTVDIPKRPGRLGRIVNRGDGQREHVRRGKRTVAGGDGDGQRALEIERRLAGEAARGKAQPLGQRIAVGEPRRKCQGIAVDVGEAAGGNREIDQRVLGHSHVGQRGCQHRSVVDRCHDQADEIAGGQNAIGRCDLEFDRAVEVRRWRAGQVSACKAEPCGQRAAVGLANRQGQGIAIDVAEGTRGHREVKRAVFGRAEICVGGVEHRCVVDRRDRHKHVLDHRDLAVERRDFEADVAVEVGRRGARQSHRPAVVLEPCRQRRSAHAAHFDQQRIAIGIADQVERQCGAERGVLGPAQGRDQGEARRVVDRGNRHRDPRGVARAGRIDDLVIEPRRAVEIGVGGDDQLADAVVGHRQPMRVEQPRQDDRLAIDVEIVGEDLRGEDRHPLVLGQRQRVVDRDRVVGHRQHVDRDRRRDRKTALVGDCVSQRHLAKEVCARREAILAVGERADPGAIQADERDRGALWSGVVGHKHRRIEVDEAVLEHLEPAVRNRHGQVELRADDQLDRPDAVRAVRVRHPVVELRVAVITLARRKHRGVADLHDCAIVAIEHFDDAEAVALDIAVVEQEFGQVDHQRDVLVAEVDAVLVGDRRVVDRRDVEGEHPGGVLATIGDGVAEVDRAEDVLVGHELVAPAGQLDDPALGVVHLHADEAERVAIGIAVVGEQVGRGEFELRVLDRREHVGRGDRRAVGRLDVDLDRADAGAVAVVGDGVFEPRLAAEVGRGGEADPGPIERDGSLRRVEHFEEADRIAVDVGIVGEQQRRIDHQHGVLDRDYHVFVGDRRIEQRLHFEPDRSGHRALGIVGQRVAERIDAREPVVRGVGDGRPGEAVEALGQRRLGSDPPDGAAEAQVEACAHVERDGRGDGARGGVERHPAGQRRTVAQRRRPDRSGGLAQRSRGQDRQRGQVDHQRAVGGLAQRGDPQAVAVVVAIVADEVGEREGNTAGFEQGNRVGLGDRLFGLRGDVEHQRRRIERHRTLVVRREVIKRDRAVVVLGRVDRDPFGAGGGRKAVVFLDGKRPVDRHTRQDRHRRQRRSVAGNVETNRQLTDVGRGRQAIECQSLAIEVQPARQRRAALAARRDACGRLEVDREEALRREESVVVEQLVDRRIERLGRVDHELEGEAFLGRRVHVVGQVKLVGGKGDLQTNHRRIGIGFEARQRQRHRRKVEAQPVGQRSSADQADREAAVADIEQRNVAVIYDPARQRRQIERQAGAAGHRHRLRSGAIGEVEHDIDRRGRSHRRSAGKGPRLRVERKPLRQRAAVGQPRGDVVSCAKAGRGEFERRMVRLAHAEIAHDLSAQGNPGGKVRGIVRVEAIAIGVSRAVRRILDEHHRIDRLGRAARPGPLEGHRRGIEAEPVRQRLVVARQPLHGERRRKELRGQLTQYVRRLEEQHVALQVEIVAERLAGDDVERLVLEPCGDVVEQHRRIVARDHGNRDPRLGGAALPVADGVFEPGAAVEIGARAEFDHALIVDPDLAVVGKAIGPVEVQRIAVLVAVVGEQRRRIDHQQRVFERAKAVVVARDRRIVERADPDPVMQSRRRAARVDHVERDVRTFVARGQPFGRVGDGLRNGIEDRIAVVGGLAVGGIVDADERIAVTLDVVDGAHQVGDRDRRSRGQADCLLLVADARGVVDRFDVELDLAGGGGAPAISDDVFEPGESEVIGADLELDVRAVDLPRNVRRVAGVVLVLVGIEFVARLVTERIERDDMEFLELLVAVDVEVVDQQVLDPDPQDRVLGSDKRPVGDRHRRVVDRRQVDLDPGGGFAPEFVAYRVVEERVAVVVGGGGELDHPVFADARAAEAFVADRDQGQAVETFGDVVDDQRRRIDHRDLVFHAEAIDVVLRVEAAGADQLFHPRAVPHGAVGEDDFLDARRPAKEVVLDRRGVGEEPAVVLELDQQVVAHADERDVLGQDVRAQHDPVGIGFRAQFGDDILGAVEPDDVGIRAEAAADIVVGEAAVERVVAGTADQGVDVVRAEHVLDSDERIARRITRKTLAEREIDGDAAVGVAVVGGIEPAAPIEHVRAEPTAQPVVATVAAQHVVVVTALDDLDPGEGVALGVAAARRAVGHVDRHAGQRQRVVGDVDAFAAAQSIRAAPADQQVVARATAENVVAAMALEPVGSGVALDDVGEIAADDILDRHQRIACRVSARCGSRGERDRHAFGRTGAGGVVEVVGGVVARAAIDQVGARAALDPVVARAAIQAVGPGAAFQQVVAAFAVERFVAGRAAELIGELGADQCLDADVLVARGHRALADPRFQIGADADVGAGEHHGVEARAADDPVRARAAVDQVVAVARVDQVVAGPGLDRIVPAERDDPVVRVRGLDQIGERPALDIVDLDRTLELAAVEVVDRGERKAGILESFGVRDPVLNRDVAGEALREADHDELLAAELDHFEAADADVATLRQFGRIEHRVDPDEARPRTIGIVEIGIERAVAVPVRLLDVVIVADQVGNADYQRNVEWRDEARIVDHRRIVVRGDDHDIDVADGDAVGVVGDAIFESAGGAGVAERGEQDVAVDVVLERAVEPALGGEIDQPQRIAIDVGIVAEQRGNRDLGRDVLENVDRVVVRHRRGIADVFEPHRNHAAVDQAFGIGDGVGERRLAPEIGVGGEDQVAPDQRKRAVNPFACLFEEHRETFGVVVVLEQFDDRNDHRNVLGAVEEIEVLVAIAVVARHRAIVDRGVGDRRPRPRIAALIVGDLIVEPGVAVEIGGRFEQHGRVGQQPRDAAARIGHRGDPHRIAIAVDVVGEQAVGADHDRIVFEDRRARLGQGKAIRGRLGRIVDRGDGNIDPRSRADPGGIGDHIVEERGAPVVVARCDVDRTIGIERGIDACAGDQFDDRQGVAIHVAVVGQQGARVDVEGGALCGHESAVRDRDRGIVDRGDRDRNLGLGASALGGVGDVGEFGGAVEIGGRGERDIAVAGQRDGAVLRAEHLPDDHPVAVEIVRQQPFDTDGEELVFGHGEPAVGKRGGDRADTNVDPRFVERIAPVCHGIADVDRARVAARRGEQHVARCVDRGDPAVARIDRDDPQRIPVRIEIVSEQFARLDQQRETGGDGVEPVVRSHRCAVVEQHPDRVARPAYAIGEREAFDRA